MPKLRTCPRGIRTGHPGLLFPSRHRTRFRRRPAHAAPVTRSDAAGHRTRGTPGLPRLIRPAAQRHHHRIHLRRLRPAAQRTLPPA